MKLLNLYIKRYGHFSEQSIAFEEEGLQLLTGPNEAGKSTLLQFIRDILFTFGQTNPYDFKEGRLEGVATMRLSSDQIVELRRHKGRKATVDVRIDGQETTYNAETFLTLLGGATQNLFRSVFAFGLEELANADSSLDDGVRAALYGGGLATVGNPQRIFDALAGEASKLFKEQGRNQRINQLCSELQSLAAQAKAKSIRSDDYHRARGQFDQAEREARQAAAEKQELDRACSHAKRLLNAFPVWCELRASEDERLGLSAPAGFPADADQTFSLAVEAITRNETARRTLLDEIEETRRELERLTFDPALLEQRASIEYALQMVQSVKEARRDLPVVRSELETSRQGVERELSKLVPGWRLEHLSGFTFDAAREAALDALVSEKQWLEQRKTELTTQRNGVQENLRQITDDLAAIPDAEDVSMLRDVLEQQETYNSQRRDLAQLQEARLANAHAIDALAIGLNPPLAVFDKAHELPVPPKETVARFKKNYQDHERQVMAAGKSLAEESARVDALDKELAALDGSGDLLPTRDRLAHVRARRDTGWNLLRKRYIAGEDVDAKIENWLSGGNLALADAYEEAVREADHYSDIILARASAVAKREELEVARCRLEKKRQSLDELETAEAELDRKWHEQWKPCGFVPLDADAMEGWLRNHARLRELARDGAAQTEATCGLEERIAFFESHVRRAVGGKDQSCAALLAMAKRRVAQAETTEHQRQTLLKSQRDLQTTIGHLAGEIEKHARQEKTWQSRWTAYLREIGLPEEWLISLAQKVIGQLTTVQEQLRGVPKLEERVKDMERRLDDFAALFARICEAVAQDRVDPFPEIGIARLHESLALAVQSEVQHAGLTKALGEKHGWLRKIDAELAAARVQRQRLLQLALVENDEDFRQVAARARRIADLDVAVARHRRELDRFRENEDTSEFARLLSEADRDALKERVRVSTERLKEAEEKAKLANEHVGDCRRILLELEKGDGQAAQLQEQLAGKRARLAAEVDRYVPLVFAQQLLEQAIKKFEQESQPAMLKDVSSIFVSMTGGRYIRVQRSNDDDALVVRRADDRLLETSELSTGTREQLYLAIRLAYVLHYCGRAEPLPIVMDDVLANFDDDRALRTLETLGKVSRQVQVLMFTCHPHIAALAQTAFPGLQPIEIAAGQPACA